MLESSTKTLSHSTQFYWTFTSELKIFRLSSIDLGGEVLHKGEYNEGSRSVCVSAWVKDDVSGSESEESSPTTKLTELFFSEMKDTLLTLI